MSATFWETLSIYCSNLAPVAGPLLDICGKTAGAIHTAECETRQLEREIGDFHRLNPASPD